MRLFSLLALIIFAGFLISSCSKQQPEQNPFELFLSDQVTEISIDTDFAHLLSNKENREYQPGAIQIGNGIETNNSYPIIIRTGGHRRMEVCENPPMKMKFDDVEEAEQYFSDHSVKLVIHCKEDPEFSQLVLKEYLMYKIYSTLTDQSLRAQLIKIRNPEQKVDSLEDYSYGFVLENADELAIRMGGKVIPKEAPATKRIDFNQYKLFVLFQFMTGNTDWNISNRHNIEIISFDEAKSSIPVPYDFDYSGFVEAPYAEPYPTLPISSVKERLFQWRGKGEDDFSTEVDLFKNKKAEIFNLCKSLPMLKENVQTEMIQYLQSFYDIVEVHEGTITASLFQKPK